MKDKQILKALTLEKKRQKTYFNLIASENYVSKNVLKITGSILTNKYAEGYSGARYYGGTENIDVVEDLANQRLQKLFNAKYSNVQPHSGTQANFAVYNALLKPGDKILGMSLDSGGHLTHGHFVNLSGKIYEAYGYGISKETKLIDYDEIEKLALKIKPKLIICGASAYPRFIDFKKFKEIGKKVNAYVLADIAHIAGQIAAGYHQNPLDVGVDVVTSTTHKALRGARGGFILTNDKELSTLINKSVFPGTQGGPLMHQIGGKAVAFSEALNKKYKNYMKNVIDNAKAMSKVFENNNYVVTHHGTDTHLFIVDVKKSFSLNGKEATELLNYANIVVNKNMIPFDEERPIHTSGIRMGTPAMTTIGVLKKDFERIAEIIIDILKSKSIKKAQEYRKEVKGIIKKNKRILWK